jgi:hypothetical protein
MEEQLHRAQVGGMCEIDWARVRRSTDVAMRALRDDRLTDRVIEVIAEKDLLFSHFPSPSQKTL